MDGIHHPFHQCLRRRPPVGADSLCGFRHPLVAKLSVLGVLGLVQSVGVEENGGAAIDGGVLRRVRPALHDARRHIAVDGQQTDAFSIIRDEQRRVVTRVAVGCMARLQIDDANEQSDEHAQFIVLGNGVAQLADDALRPFLVGRDGAEQRPRHGHH